MTGQADNYSSVLPLLQGFAETVEGVFQSSAAETGGSRSMRFVCDGGGHASVISETVSAAAAGSFTTMITELLNKGYTSPTQKYLE